MPGDTASPTDPRQDPLLRGAPLRDADRSDDAAAIATLDRTLDSLLDDPSQRVDAPTDRSSPLAGTAVALRALDDARPPTPTFVTDLEEQLMSAVALDPTRARPAASPPARARLRVDRTDAARRPIPAASRRRGLVEFVSFSALIALLFGQAMGMGGSFAFWRDQATPMPAAEQPLAMERVDAGRTGTYPTAGPAGEIGLVTRLAPTIAADTNGGMPYFLNPMAAGDDLYQPELLGSSVSSYDLTTGRYWPGAATPDMHSNIAVGHGHVYINGQPRTAQPGTTGSLTALDPETWAEVWSYPLAGAVDAPVLVAGDLVYALDAAGTIHAVDGESGTGVWTASIAVAEVDTGDGHLEAFATFGSAWLAAGDGVVVVTTPGTTLSAFDAATGAPRWTFEAPAGTHLGPPVVADGSVLVLARNRVSGQGTGEGALVRLSTKDGAEEWSSPIAAWDAELGDVTLSTRELGDAAVLTVDAERAYVVDVGARADGLAAVSLADGAEEWRVSIGEAETKAPVVAGDELYVTRGDGRIAALSTGDGAERWSLATGKFGLSTPVVSSERIAVLAADGTLFVLGPVKAGATPSADGVSADDVSGMAPCVSPRLQPDPLPVGTPAHALGVAPGADLLLADVPTGPVADGDTFAGIFRTLDAMPACRRTDMQRELGGFYSDDYYRRIPADQPDAARGYLYLTTLGDDLALDDLNAPFELPDGRIGLLVYDDVLERGSLIVFVEQDGAWLVDEQQSVALEQCTTCG